MGTRQPPRRWAGPPPTSCLCRRFRNGTGVDIVTRLANGTVQTATHTGTSLSAWRTVGTGATDRPAVVNHVNGDLQIFVRTADGKLATKRETDNVFPVDWQILDGVDVVGSPAAALRDGSLVDLAVRGADNLVYQASQLAPASSAFSPWTVRIFDETATDPTSLVLSSGSPIFTWRTPSDLLVTAAIPGAGQRGGTATPEYVATVSRPQS